MCDVLGITPSQFWNRFTVEFWSKMSWTNDAFAILERVELAFGAENVYILTSPANAVSAHGKMLWLQACLPGYYRNRRYMLGSARELCAKGNTILVDDRDENIDNFLTEGGHGILYPRFCNRRHKDIVGYDFETELKQAIAAMV